MSLPTLDSSEQSTIKGAVHLMEPEYLTRSRERGASAEIGSFPGWPSSLYNELNRKSSMPPKAPGESTSVLLRTTSGMADAASPKWAEDLRHVCVDPLEPFGSAWESHFTVSHHGVFPPDAHNKLLIDWAKDVPAQVEIRLLIQGIKLYLDRDVEKARMIARRAANKFPESRDLHQILKLLIPSRVLTRAASGASRKDDFQWIRANQNHYRGQWVALFEGKCLASGIDLNAVRESARRRVDLERVLITFLPKETGS